MSFLNLKYTTSNNTFTSKVVNIKERLNDAEEELFDKAKIKVKFLKKIYAITSVNYMKSENPIIIINETFSSYLSKGVFLGRYSYIFFIKYTKYEHSNIFKTLHNNRSGNIKENILKFEAFFNKREFSDYIEQELKWQKPEGNVSTSFTDNTSPHEPSELKEISFRDMDLLPTGNSYDIFFSE